MNFKITFIGVLVGFFSGMFGKGGSAIGTPLLQLIGVPAFYAVASPLPAAIPGTLIAAFAYLRTGYFEKRIVFWGILAGVPATVVGSLLSPYIGGTNLLALSNLLLIAMGASYFFPRLTKSSATNSETPRSPRKEIFLNILIATIAGLISGALANAGGFLLAPLYNKVLKLPLKSAFSCSLLISCVLAIPGTITHMELGHIDWTVVTAFGIGSVPLSYLGARTAIRMPITKLEHLFGIVLTIIGVWGMIDLYR